MPSIWLSKTSILENVQSNSKSRTGSGTEVFSISPESSLHAEASIPSSEVRRPNTITTIFNKKSAVNPKIQI